MKKMGKLKMIIVGCVSESGFFVTFSFFFVGMDIFFGVGGGEGIETYNRNTNERVLRNIRRGNLLQWHASFLI